MKKKTLNLFHQKKNMSNEFERVDLVDTHHYCEVNQYGLVELKIEKKDSVYMNENDYEIARTNSNRDNTNKEANLKGSFLYIYYLNDIE